MKLLDRMPGCKLVANLHPADPYVTQAHKYTALGNHLMGKHRTSPYLSSRWYGQTTVKKSYGK
jgi:hypothetical protein